MNKSFSIGGTIGSLIGVFVSLGLFNGGGIVFCAFGGFFIGGALATIFINKANTQNAIATSQEIDSLTDTIAQAAILALTNNSSINDESTAKNYLNRCNKILALKYRYNNKDYFNWIVISDTSKVFNVNSYGTPSTDFPDISIKEIAMTHQKYNPAQLVYTGATVGGVHTGGFHKEDAYISESHSSSGKYAMYLRINKPEATPGTNNSTAYVKIDEILLSKSIMDTVPEYLKCYANDYKLVLKHEKTADTAPAIFNGTVTPQNTVNYSNMAMRSYLDKQLTKQQCQSIKEWIYNLK